MMIRNGAVFLLLSQLLLACGDTTDPGADASGGTAGAGGSGTAGRGGSGNAGASGRPDGSSGSGGSSTAGSGGSGGSTGGVGGASGSGGSTGGVGGASGSGGSTGGVGGSAGARDSGPGDAPRVDAGLPDNTTRDAFMDTRDATTNDVAADVATPDVGTMDSASPDVTTPDAACRQASVVLGAADNFVVLAGSTVTSLGATVLTGDLGLSPGTMVTGSPTVNGTQHVNDTTAAQGIADLTTAYNDAAGRTLCPISVTGNLGGQTLTPGLYKSTSSLEISSGDLTLDAQGDSTAVFIFQMASTLMTSSGRQVILTGSAKSTNVFWQVGSSATLGTTSAFQGTIMADQAVSMGTGATLNGRALARIAGVTLDTNTIVKPAL